MKKLLFVSTMLSMLSLCSCSKVIYTNDQVMNDFKTKESIVKRFGMPDEKRTTEDAEEWLYRFDRSNMSINQSAASNANSKTVNVANFIIYKKYVIFRIDQHGSVLSWQCEGVDFTKRKPNPLATIALIVLLAGGIGLIVGLSAMASMSIFL